MSARFRAARISMPSFRAQEGFLSATRASLEAGGCVFVRGSGRGKLCGTKSFRLLSFRRSQRLGFVFVDPSVQDSVVLRVADTRTPSQCSHRRFIIFLFRRREAPSTSPPVRIVCIILMRLGLADVTFVFSFSDVFSRVLTTWCLKWFCAGRSRVGSEVNASSWKALPFHTQPCVQPRNQPFLA
jgi:hypothetical protein